MGLKVLLFRRFSVSKCYLVLFSMKHFYLFKQGWKNFFLGAQSGTQKKKIKKKKKMGAQNQIACPIETIENIIFCSLLPK